MKFNDSMIIMECIKDLQSEMNKKSSTDLVVDVGDNGCLFSIYFSDSKVTVDVNKRFSSIFSKLEKKFDVKSSLIGKTVTCYIEAKKEE